MIISTPYACCYTTIYTAVCMYAIFYAIRTLASLSICVVHCTAGVYCRQQSQALAWVLTF